MTIEIHPQTAVALTSCAKNKPHALLLQGVEGVGLYTLATKVAHEYGIITDVVVPEAKTKSGVPAISVERVRQLYEVTKSKNDSSHVVIIDDADSMTESAQNALLKLLEEPAANMHFILTSHKTEKLLPTIRSRIQIVSVSPVDQAATARILRSLGTPDEAMKKQLLYVAAGLPALMSRLVESPQAMQSLVATIRTAREYIHGTSYEKLLVQKSLGNDRRAALELIDAILLLLHRTLSSQPDRQTMIKIDSLLTLKDSLQANGNVQLQMAAIVL